MSNLQDGFVGDPSTVEKLPNTNSNLLGLKSSKLIIDLSEHVSAPLCGAGLLVFYL